MKLDSIIFYSHDLDLVIPFYQNVLNLNIEYQQEDKYVSFWLDDGIRLGIKKATEARELPGAQTIFLTVNNIDRLCQTLSEQGIEFYKPLEQKPWGKEASILDPDGNKILLIQRTS